MIPWSAVLISAVLIVEMGPIGHCPFGLAVAAGARFAGLALVLSEMWRAIRCRSVVWGPEAVATEGPYGR